MTKKLQTQKLKKCKNCFKEKLIDINRVNCKPCHSEIEVRRQKENKLETEPWRYVECSECMEIWRLKKKKLKNGRRQGLKHEEYERSDCPNCGAEALQFKNNRTLNTYKVKKEVKKKQKEMEMALIELEKFKRKKVKDTDNDYCLWVNSYTYNYFFSDFSFDEIKLKEGDRYDKD